MKVRSAEMANIESFIEGSQKLTSIFGRWPSFHDAEILELHFLRGYVQPEKCIYNFPLLTLKIHLWDLTREVDGDGFFVLRNHILTTLKFTDVAEFQMEGFNDQNAMLSLSVNRHERSESPSPFFMVNIAPAFGMGASFECTGIEVVDAASCTGDAQPLHPR
jgi:hypothetical protein